MNTDRTMRWYERRSRFVRDDGFIDPRRYATEVIENERAAIFIARHHYLATMPVTQLCVGLFGPRNGETTSPLVGTAIFAVPSTPAAIAAHSGVDPAAGTTLARFILLDCVPANGETHFLARAFRALRREKSHLEAVVSYADPQAGHIGHIYAAASAAHRGQTKARTNWSISGQTIHGRTLSKIRAEDRGHLPAIERLVALGAPPPGPRENAPAWLTRIQGDGTLTRALHPGYYVYNFPLTRRARARSGSIPTEPYPTLASSARPERTAP